jgi:hypothetical protein
MTENAALSVCPSDKKRNANAERQARFRAKRREARRAAKRAYQSERRAAVINGSAGGNNLRAVGKPVF